MKPVGNEGEAGAFHFTNFIRLHRNKKRKPFLFVEWNDDDNDDDERVSFVLTFY